ncbi:hypothetical protein [Alkalihalobacillus trypoxylicola]|uniref:hypothetical protein n=1 Tax=Alkalihalobacillus trypoxylicola TaxID=519424 RepID=UPI000B2C933E|nr:hypothetical protein [Alkalihalobacillus trypoxylicola]
MTVIENLESELKELRSKKNTAYRTIKMCDERIEALEEAIEHLRILPRYQKEDDND